MALSADESSRLAGLLDEHADRLAKRWTEIVAASVRGRLSQIELHRQVEELQRVLRACLGDGEFDLDGDGGVELRAVLAQLSRNRARQGFSATETAVRVFAFKEWPT